MARRFLIIPIGEEDEDNQPGCGTIFVFFAIIVIGFFVFRACSGGGI